MRSFGGVALVVLMAGAAAGDESTPRPEKAPAQTCVPPPPAMEAEVERLLQSAAEHATHSQVCVDGDGERVTIKLLAACVERPKLPPNADAIALQVRARYRVTVAGERGGECTPYPECAKAPPPRVSVWQNVLAFGAVGAGLRLVVPSELAGVTLRTPLDREHSTGCHGKRAAFVPRTLPPK